MQHIEHDISINSSLWSSTRNSRLLHLRQQASQMVPVNVCEFFLSHPGDVSVRAGDQVEVKLGIDESKALVFTGMVSEVKWQMDKVLISAAGGARRLTAARYNMYFERPLSGDIVQALCQEAEVTTGRIDTGLPLDFYAVGDQLSAFEHIEQLALKNGFDLFTNERDELQFVLPIPGNVHTFSYGINILTLEAQVPEEGITGIEIYGESPASLGQGPLAAHWLTKKEVLGSAGDQSGRMKRVIAPAVRNIQTATLMAQAQLLREKSKQRATLRCLGRPDIRIGDLALITQMPVSDQNGSYKVTGIRHRIDPATGYTTLLNLEAVIG